MQPSPSDNSVAVNSVQYCVAWLDHASKALNPNSIMHHSISVQEMQDFICRTSPPPPALQEQWSSKVWAMPGEPYEVYFLRCLARQSGVTLLSPHFSCRTPLQEKKHLKLDASPASSLFAEACVVVGLRVEPTASNLLQTGWDTQPCRYCAKTSPHHLYSAVATCTGVPLPLPLLYGGDTCAHCRRAFPLLPAWTRVVYLVLQLRDHTRMAAVAYGDGALRHLSLGAAVDALLYRSQTEQHEPLLVLHAAAPCSLVFPVQVPCVFSEQGANTSTNNNSRSYFRSFYDNLQSNLLTQKWIVPCRSLDDIARGISPKLLGQIWAKKTVLLVVLYTLYCAQRCTRDAARRPLHLLLLGPAKTGKSALLRDVQILMGAQADVLNTTVVRSIGKGTGKKSSDGASFLSALPSRRRDLLMAGPSMTATTLVLDHLPASSAAAVLAPLKEVLEHQRGCVTEGESTEDTTVMIDLPVHLIAAAEEESASAVQLAPFFALVASLIPANSLDESALISQDVVAASRARASSSRAPASRSGSFASSMSSSLPSISSSPSASQRGDSLTRDHDTSGAIAERLTADDVQYLLRRAADPAVLGTVMNAAVCHASFMPNLIASASLVEDAQPLACPVLPPPSACRRSQLAQMSAVSSDGTAAAAGQLDATPLIFDVHLRVLQCLSLARLMLETAEEVCVTGWTAEMRDEVWQLYERHLVTLANLLHQSNSRSENNTARIHYQAENSQAPAVPAMLPPTRADWTPWPLSNARVQRSGSTVKKLSKKRARLHYIEELRRCQSRSADSGGGTGGIDDVISPAEAENLYAQMGGSAVLGDLLDVVMSQLQEEGLVLRRLGGWRVL